MKTVLRLPEVKLKTGLSRSSLYNFIKQGNFPPPIKLGARSSGWLNSEIEAWIQQRTNASRGQNKMVRG